MKTSVNDYLNLQAKLTSGVASGSLQPDCSAQGVDVEIIVRPIPYSGVGRHLGGPCDAKGIRDNAAIARALRKVADELDAQNAGTQRPGIAEATNATKADMPGSLE